MSAEVVADPAATIEALRDARDRLAQDGPPPGAEWCRAATAVVDDAITTLAEGVGITVLAVGGYGREELCPGSDVDLLLLHRRRDDVDLEGAVRAVVYPLWDAALKVGYAVRDHKEAVAAVDDLDTATAMLDARFLCGDRGLARRVVEESASRLQRRLAKFLEALTEADGDRRRGVGDAAETLEPNLKNGAGGLRDVQSLAWASAVLVGRGGLDPLVGAGYLGAPDRARLVRAHRLLLAERVATHLAAERALDTLEFPYQDDVADRLGYVDGDGVTDTKAHRLLSEHFLAARTIDHVHRRAWRFIMSDAAGGRRRRRRQVQEHVDQFEVTDGVLRVPDMVSIDHPDLPVRLLEAMVATGALLDRTTATRLRARASDEDVPWGWDDHTRGRFTAVLWQGSAVLAPLAELDDAGAIVALVPPWGRVRGRAQRNPFHRYSLDRHAWHAAATLGDLVREEDWAAQELGRVQDREALVLGVWLHDVGKAWGEPHSITGQPVAADILTHMGASERTISRVQRMMELHLLLPDVATKRDLSDLALVEDVAAQVGDRELLACLHLLAAADGRATGPSAWSAWKASLVRSLVVKVAAVLESTNPDEVGDGAVVSAQEAQELSAAMGSSPAQVNDHLRRLPQRYASQVSARSIVRHAVMASTPCEPAEVRTRVTLGEQRQDDLAPYDELDVVAIDAPGLFAKVAGVLSINGGSIVGASAFTRDDGLAVDTFVVSAPEGAPTSWWARVEGDLVDAMAGRLALRARLARKARTEDRRLARLPDVATSVTVTADDSGQASVIEVKTLDRTGVLFTITDALAELQLDIVVARIQTLGPEAVDVFTVRSAEGGAIDDDHAAEVVLAVESALAALADE